MRKFVFRAKVGKAARADGVAYEAASKLSSDELSALNWQRRVHLVRHCHQQVPYYQAKFKEIGFEPGDLKSERDFESLPILEKEDVRQNQQQLIANTANRKRMRGATTGGTTGEPLTIYSDPQVPLSPMTWRMLQWWGLDVSDNSAYLYRSVPTGLRKALTSGVLYPTRRAYLAAAEMSRKRMGSFLKSLRVIKPRYLVGYVGAIDAFADYFQEVDAHLPSLKAIWTTAAPLPELKRKRFEEVFGCPVYTQYGCVEMFMISAECQRRQGLHVFSDIRHVEMVEGTESVEVGEHGDIIVTDMTNYAFPLLRYRLGDRGRLLKGSSDCSLPFPLMDYVKGRISDQIYLADGTSIPGEYWTTIFDDYPQAIKSFQVYQKNDYSIEVRYEPYLGDATVAIASVRKMLDKKLKGHATFSFVRMTIDNNENGKTRFVKSEIQK